MRSRDCLPSQADRRASWMSCHQRPIQSDRDQERISGFSLVNVTSPPFYQSGSDNPLRPIPFHGGKPLSCWPDMMFLGGRIYGGTVMGAVTRGGPRRGGPSWPRSYYQTRHRIAPRSPYMMNPSRTLKVTVTVLQERSSRMCWIACSSS